jgi:RNA polymerase sigma-70 factor (ECF subfamily)
MSGPHADFEKAYNEYYAEIRRFIYTIARQDPDITDDISQNTWQNAYTWFDSLRDTSSRRSWLYAIARNEAKRYFANRHNVFFSNALTLDGDDDAVDAIDEAETAFPEALANSDLLAALLGKLTVEEQRLILLHYAYDVDLKEIADMEGTNYNTLKSVFRRAMEKLRKAANEMGADIR